MFGFVHSSPLSLFLADPMNVTTERLKRFYKVVETMFTIFSMRFVFACTSHTNLDVFLRDVKEYLALDVQT